MEAKRLSLFYRKIMLQYHHLAGYGTVGSALRSGRRGREFESHYPDLLVRVRYNTSVANAKPETKEEVVLVIPFKGRASRSLTQFAHLRLEASEFHLNRRRRRPESTPSKEGILRTSFILDAASSGDFDDGE